MRKIQILLFLILSLFSLLAFDCSGIHESGCKDFTYTGTFLKTPEERVEALNKFYEKYFPNPSERRNLSFELDSNKVKSTFIRKKNNNFSQSEFKLNPTRKFKQIARFSPSDWIESWHKGTRILWIFLNLSII